MQIKIRTLTPIWTGDVNGNCTKLRETSIIGSLRWWFEAIVRGFGGYACDPTSDERCELNYKKFKSSIKERTREGKSIQESIQEALDEQICPACQLFGCTGWSRRFRLEIDGIREEDIEKGKGSKAGLKANTVFNLKFIFLSDLTPEQKWLFKKTLWIIENYGAIGGRVTWKPNGKWGTSYGLIKIEDYGEFGQWDTFSDINKVKTWLKRNKEAIGKEKDLNWFNFRFYWIVEGRYLTREQINKIVKRDPKNPKNYILKADEFDKWLGGYIGVSKKIFSFDNPQKVFGYVRKDCELNVIYNRIKEILGENIIFKKGYNILEEMI